jgi:hypothetical protein
MGKDSGEWPRGCDEAEAHDVSIGPKENRGGTASALGEGEGTAEDGGVGLKEPAANITD